ncbi:zinc/iron transporter [Pyricularia oryzae 70-15]|uniref:Zinc/iron transporter n=3 Tax=Pyricularia oryzae TaxID=318829 RepID=G4MWM1_PYRO7|nr:zinc/iron transporter [Pyricularia oryzae 70-15]EHA55076.1 zinc/iron transporter [Pyricularia oryzae 70-15]ELQ36721.1 zinc/iron transporter protein [Pyricularia oryzae Y34]KAI7921259.1 zinc/iron transporter [Pyricularia oryzae]KAI7924046.1 zinc/iron transporter [Pyricularia oryzae]
MARTTLFVAVAALLQGMTSAQTPSSTGGAPRPDPTAISLCSVRSSTQYCSAGTTEYRVVATPTGSLPSVYTACHKHGNDLYCQYTGGGEVQVAPANAAAAPTPTPAPSGTSGGASPTGNPTAVSDCHMHGSDVFCMWGTTEYQVMTNIPATATQDIPPTFTGCHAHGSDTFCLGPGGADVEVRAQGAEAGGGGHAGEGDAGGSNRHCHFHAGVEHCTGGSEEISCEKVTRDYNIPLRVGLLFVIMATSAIGVFSPILLHKVWPSKTHTALLILKQFGTGVILSTAFVHLYTHAQLMFGNKCLGELGYEATTSAIVMAGIFLSFLVEYIGKRIVLARMARSPGAVSRLSPETVSVFVLETGIIFHSILIGITLVVAGDSFFLTLFVVILFHQMFEGIALGSRIAALGAPSPHAAAAAAAPATDGPQKTDPNAKDGNSLSDIDAPRTTVAAATEPARQQAYFSLPRKLLLASPFALITPIGMAIGIGVLQHFNGNNRSTLLAIGTLDALSAGILVWVGLVEMWAEDWMVEGAEMLSTGIFTTVLAGFGLVSGVVIMSVLGKWA